MPTLKLSFTSDNLKIKGEVYVPEGKGKTYPAVIMCHGIPAAPYNPNDLGWAITAEEFCNAGFVSMVFNFRGCGLSEGNFDMLGWAEDLKAAISELLKQHEVDKTKLFLLGSSAGAAISVYVAAQDKRIGGLVTMACPAYFGFRFSPIDRILDHFREVGIIRDKDFPPSKEDWLKNFDTIASTKWIDKISPRPLLLIHGDQDDLVPVEQAKKLYEIAREPKDLLIISGASHRLRIEERAVGAALNWLKKQAA